MSPKPKRNGSTAQQVTPAQAMETGGPSVGNAAREEDIRRRAYEMYLERWEKHQHQELARVDSRVDRERRRRFSRLSEHR